MTLVAGIRCSSGGILLCADREENLGSSKRSVDKIDRLKLQTAEFYFLGAGRPSILANFLEQIGNDLRASEARNEDLFRTHRTTIQSCLTSIYGTYIWNRMDSADRQINLVIAASFYGSTAPVSMLYGTDDDIIFPAVSHVCAGSGMDLAYYFADRLISYPPGRRSAMLLAAFIFREVRESIAGVGLGTDMKFISGKERARYEWPHEHVKKVDAILPSAKDALIQLWTKGFNIPDWLVDDAPGSDLPR